MKLSPKLIDGFLAAPAREHSAALIFGADGGLVRERAGKIVKAFLGKDAGDQFAKIEFSESEIIADPSKLSDELSAFSMMSPRRVIIIRDAGNKLNKIVESASEFFNKDTYLILTADELDSKSSLRAFCEKSPKFAAFACYKDEMRDVQSVIRAKFDEAGIRAEREVVDYLASQLGSDRYVTYQELEKVILYAGEEKKISLHEAESLVDYNQETKLDDLINAVADKNLAALEKNLTQNIREGVSPILYLRALQRYFGRLYDIRAKMAGGQSADMVVAGLRPPVFFKQAPILTRHASNWSAENIVKALKILISAELSCKSSDIPAIPASSRKLLQITQVR
jgi:DNA polymerase-3 subunit delta